MENLEIYEDIAKGNEENALRVEEQAKMTKKIARLIEQVVEDTDNAINLLTKFLQYSDN